MGNLELSQQTNDKKYFSLFFMKLVAIFYGSFENDSKISSQTSRLVVNNLKLPILELFLDYL